MKIKVKNIPEEGINVHFSLEENWHRKQLPEGKGLDFTLRPADVHCFASRIGETISLSIKIESAIDMECCRCLESILTPLQVDFNYTLVPKKGEIDLKSQEEDLNFGYYETDEIDLNPIVLEQIVLQIPVKPLCRESCKGLCPGCGVNLNETCCDCRTESVDPRLAALKDFKVKKTEKRG